MKKKKMTFNSHSGLRAGIQQHEFNPARDPFLRPIEAHRAETSQDTTFHCHPEATSSPCHPEERSDVRGSGQVGAVFVSQGPHGGKAPSGRRESGESGRSMVEMLGTLAIMGVLSIGGVAGYRYAMDKFNANTILSEISKRAMTASQQRLVGQAINLNEYGAAEIQGYTVTHTNDVDGDTAFFSLSVSGVPKGICDKVIQDKLRTATEVWLNTDTDVTDGGTCDDNENGNTIEFVFANTLDPNATPTEPTPAPEPEPTPACDPACTGGQECQNGTCACPTDKPKWNGTSCEACSGSTPAWNDTECVECVTNEHCENSSKGSYCRTGITASQYTKYNNTCGCTDNTHCNDGNQEGSQYCQINTYGTTNIEGAWYTDVTGTCASRPKLTEVQIKELDADGNQMENVLKTVYKYTRSGNWWTAANICLAHGKELFDSAWLQCNDNVGVNASGKSGYCCPNGTSSCTEDASTQSVRMQAFREAFSNSGYYWTANGYNTQCTTQSCNSYYAFFAHANDGDVSYYFLHSNYYSDYHGPLCE